MILRARAVVVCHLLMQVLLIAGQEPYKGDFFRLFREAYRNGYCDVSSSPRLTADRLRDILIARCTSGNEQQRDKLIEQLCDMWDEWRYARDHYER